MDVTRVEAVETNLRRMAEDSGVSHTNFEMPPGPSDPEAREAKRGRGTSKLEDDEAFGTRSDEDPDFDKLELCVQCHLARDPLVPKPIAFGVREGKPALHERDWTYDPKTDLWGLRCECHSFQFCNQSCLEKHLRGDCPPDPPTEVKKYMDLKNRAAAGGLCLLQAHLLRNTREADQFANMEAAIKSSREAQGRFYSAPDSRGHRERWQYEGEAEYAKQAELAKAAANKSMEESMPDLVDLDGRVDLSSQSRRNLLLKRFMLAFHSEWRR